MCNWSRLLIEGGLIALEPGKGAIRAMVGGYDFARSEYNRAVQAHRQPGSAFKPIIYATAMDQGMSPGSVILDAPVVYEQEQDEKTWKPENYGRKIHGMVSCGCAGPFAQPRDGPVAG